MGRLISLAVLIAQFVSISIAVESIDLTTPVKVLNVDQASEVGQSIGLIGSGDERGSDESMKPPFYIVPIIPEDADLFRRDIRVDVDSGRIYLNSKLSRVKQSVYKFSALSINEGTAEVVVINVINGDSQSSSATTSTKVSIDLLNGDATSSSSSTKTSTLQTSLLNDQPETTVATSKLTEVSSRDPITSSPHLEARSRQCFEMRSSSSNDISESFDDFNKYLTSKISHNELPYLRFHDECINVTVASYPHKNKGCKNRQNFKELTKTLEHDSRLFQPEMAENWIGLIVVACYNFKENRPRPSIHYIDRRAFENSLLKQNVERLNEARADLTQIERFEALENQLIKGDGHYSSKLKCKDDPVTYELVFNFAELEGPNRTPRGPMLNLYQANERSDWPHTKDIDGLLKYMDNFDKLSTIPILVSETPPFESSDFNKKCKNEPYADNSLVKEEASTRVAIASSKETYYDQPSPPVDDSKPLGKTTRFFTFNRIIFLTAIAVIVVILFIVLLTVLILHKKSGIVNDQHFNSKVAQSRSSIESFGDEVNQDENNMIQCKSAGNPKSKNTRFDLGILGRCGRSDESDEFNYESTSSTNLTARINRDGNNPNDDTATTHYLRPIINLFANMFTSASNPRANESSSMGSSENRLQVKSNTISTIQTRVSSADNTQTIIKGLTTDRSNLSDINGHLGSREHHVASSLAYTDNYLSEMGIDINLRDNYHQGASSECLPHSRHSFNKNLTSQIIGVHNGESRFVRPVNGNSKSEPGDEANLARSSINSFFNSFNTLNTIKCVDNKMDYMDVCFNKWYSLLDWVPEYTNLSNVLDDLVLLNENTT